MAAPTFASLYRISVRRADGGISFRPKTHNIVSQKVKDNLVVFAGKMTGLKGASSIAAICGHQNSGKLGADKKEHTPFKRFRGCLRNQGAKAYRGG
jgi:hypothetical protein